MLNIYTVSFFGHREVEGTAEIEKTLDMILRGLITKKEYVEFLIGDDGEFDMLASSAIKRTIESCNYGNTHFTLVLPYMKADYRDNKEKYLSYYDEVEICAESANAYAKSAIQIRNRNIVDRSDLILCYICRKNGGAYKTVQYAKKCGKSVINIAEKNVF